jgi:pseudouridylate synthase
LVRIVNEPALLASKVEDALLNGRPVVALETTVMTHGLPSPVGRTTAAEMEHQVRSGGAIPCTIGILGGRLRVGLTPAEMDELAGAGGEKVNLSNLAACIARAGSGSTTVAATLFAAHRAGIQVLATGGVGGVHRGFAETGDVSGDLGALARFPVAVVCAGAKAVLDIPRTLEALETLGVPVYGFRTEVFPAFYRRDSGCPVEARFDSEEALARAVHVHFALGSGTGVIVANPVPAAAEMDGDLYEHALAEALEEADRQQIRGRAVTPFLLERLRLRTGGQSVETNRALLLDNARTAAALARTLLEVR